MSKVCYTPLTLLHLLLCSYVIAWPAKDRAVFTGKCTYYKVEPLANGNAKLIRMSKGEGRLVLDRKERKFYFYYKEKLAFVYFGYTSQIDSMRKEETFRFDSDATATWYLKEKTFVLNIEMMNGGRQGYQYELTYGKLK